MKLLQWQHDTRKVKDLVAYNRNPRKITKTRFEQLKKKIESQGYRNPICLDEKGMILAGHQRFRALVDLGFGDMVVNVMIPPRGLKLTKQLKDEIIVSDNVSWGEFDVDILTSDFDLEQLKNFGVQFEFPQLNGATDKPEDKDGTPDDEEEKFQKVKCPECSCKFLINSKGKPVTE